MLKFLFLVCQKRSNEGRRFVSSTMSFTSYVVCSQGGHAEVRGCPSNSIFFVVLQCCVPAFKFPCSQNCIHNNNIDDDIPKFIDDDSLVNSDYAHYYFEI